MSKLNFTPIIPAGETILVTGANGYIAAQVVDNLLSFGYRVRGTVRNVEKNKALVDKLTKKHGEGKVEFVQVDKILEEGAFNEAIKGVSGIAHIATDTNIPGEPEPYIQNNIDSALSLLRLATTEPSVKRFVLTASSMGAVPWKSDVEYSFGTDAYNDEYVKLAYAEPHTPDKAWYVYGASKTQTERAIQKWIAENKPNFVYNAVLPALNIGDSVSGAFGSTGGWTKAAADGDFSLIQYVPPQHFINTNDNALLHVGALLHPEVQNERLFGFAEPYSWNSILAILRKLYPGQKLPEDLPGLGKDLSHPPKERSEFVLKGFGQDGYKGLEESLKEAFDTIWA
ncbi:NAD-P-binding protein [Paraphoma chrysanthemicola]|uniref:NAD-P-binding protein n=1 Tax=Paraphoma chrysanthemicola TaxID=798071 RepID=A0A8K0VUT8_9PLEO|nr:NAD-P-binding protein [Paraphoma chrysanthemicola]